MKKDKEKVDVKKEKEDDFLECTGASIKDIVISVIALVVLAITMMFFLGNIYITRSGGSDIEGIDDPPVRVEYESKCGV